MAHTAPDYTSKGKTARVFWSIDNAELAARLGSINTYDRRGNVVWYDDMETGANKWIKNTVGAGASIATTNTASRNGTYSMLLTTGSTLTFAATLTKNLPLPSLVKLGLELSLNFDADMESVAAFYMVRYNNVRYTAGVEFDHVNNVVKYWTSAGAWSASVKSVTYLHTLDMFYQSKLVVDFATGKYVRLLFGDASIDLSTISMQSAANAGNNILTVQIGATGTNAKNALCYIDDVILTQNDL